MKPGRKLDALIAEKVMGWGTVDPSQTPDYSTDIAAAWEVVEKFYSSNIAFDAEDCDWEVTLHDKLKTEPGIKTVYTQSDTVSHAICLAALKAVGYSDDE